MAARKPPPLATVREASEARGLEMSKGMVGSRAGPRKEAIDGKVGLRKEAIGSKVVLLKNDVVIGKVGPKKEATGPPIKMKATSLRPAAEESQSGAARDPAHVPPSVAGADEGASSQAGTQADEAGGEAEEAPAPPAVGETAPQAAAAPAARPSEGGNVVPGGGLVETDENGPKTSAEGR